MSVFAGQTHTLRCVDCAADISPGQAAADFRCACGGLFDVRYKQPLAPREQLAPVWAQRRSSAAAEDASGVWRFREALPILSDPAKAVTWQEGNTPLFAMPQCAAWAGVDLLWAKHQGMNPTGSFKDTGMTAALSVAREHGARWVACASTGNTSAAMAAYAARAGMRSLVLLPEGKIAWGKLSQAMDAGALTIQLPTDFDGCVRVLNEVVRRGAAYLLNSVNPYRLEGQKTPAFEIAETMAWNVPDHVIVPGGNLANSSALGIGFQQLVDAGWISRMPKISIVQASGANPLVRAMERDGGASLDAVTAQTRASAIRIGNPASWKKAVRVLRATGGWALDVTETEIAIAKAQIGAEGIGCEPASAVTLAGLRHLVRDGRVRRGDTVVLVLTGHLLKDADYTIAFHRGELLTREERAIMNDEQRNDETRLLRAPLTLEAGADAVLRALDADDRSPR